MKHELTIVDTQRHHCGKMTRRIRTEQVHPIYEQNGGIHKTIISHFNKSIICKSAFVGGKIVAIGGLQKDILSDDSFVWLSTSKDLKSFGISIILRLIKEIKKYMDYDKNIISIINMKDDRSVDFSKFLGFKMVENIDNCHSDFAIIKIDKKN